MKLVTQGEVEPVWQRQIGATDAPDGLWVFVLANEGERIAMILPSEW